MEIYLRSDSQTQQQQIQQQQELQAAWNRWKYEQSIANIYMYTNSL